jgi:copper chaperone
VESQVELKVDGMTCQGCVRSVTKKLSGMAGVSDVAVDLAAGNATVGYDPSTTKASDLIAAVEQIGFHASLK